MRCWYNGVAYGHDYGWRVLEKRVSTMAAATLGAEIAIGTTEVLERTIRNVKELSPDDVQTVLLTCDFIHSLLKTNRAQVESDLCRGMKARDFVGQYERWVSGLDIVKTAVDRFLERRREKHPPSLDAELVSKCENMAAHLVDFRHFLLDALAMAKKSSRPIDWERVREVEEAYARGETKPFRKTAGS